MVVSPRKLGVHPSTMTCVKITPLLDPGDYAREKLLNADRVRLLENENSHLRKLVSKLRRDLASGRSIAE
jgi:hypothetical protein